MENGIDDETGQKVQEELDPWVRIQSQTFVNWVNDKLRVLDLKVDDITCDFRDGVKLCRLVNVLKGSGLSGRVINKQKINKYEARANLSLGLEALEADGVKLVNIGAVDIEGGNLKLILGLIWLLIRRYQIGSQTKLPPKKLMLSWINAVLHPYMEVNNFSSDWNDGVALHGIIDYCSPGSCPTWPTLSRSNKLANCQAAMSLARTLFNIPLVVSAEDFSSRHLDELSGMTYLSYFMAEGTPGYQATLNWVKSHTDVTNFDKDWNNGRHLSELVQSLGGHLTGWPTIDTSDGMRAIQTAMDTSKRDLGVDHVISAADMTSVDVDHIGVMAYVAWHQQITTFKNNNAKEPEPIPEPVPEPVVELPPPPPSPSPPPPPPPPVTEIANIQIRGVDNWRIHTAATITVNTEQEGDGDIKAISTSPHGMTSQLTCSRVEKYQHHVIFPADTKGVWSITVEYENREAAMSPWSINVYDPSLVILTGNEDSAILDEVYAMQVDCGNAGLDDLDVHVIRSGESLHCDVRSLGNFRYDVSFVPRETGVHNIMVYCGGVEIPGGSRQVFVSTPSKVRFGTIETIGRQSLIEDDDDNDDDDDDDSERLPPYPLVTTQPEPEVKTTQASPVETTVRDVTGITVSGAGVRDVIQGQDAVFDVDTRSYPDKELRCSVIGPSAIVKSTIECPEAGKFRVFYTPTEVGSHKIRLSYDGIQVRGSPFDVYARKPTVYVKNLNPMAVVGMASAFNIDAAEMRKGTLEIDSDLPVREYKKTGPNLYQVTFVPKRAGKHDLVIKYDGTVVQGSPFDVDVHD